MGRRVLTTTHPKKKNKEGSRPPKPPSNPATDEKQRQQQLFSQQLRQEKEGKDVDWLTEHFHISLQEAGSVYKQADKDRNKAIEILSSRLDGDTKSEGPDPSTRESSSTSGLDFTETGCVQNVVTGRGKQPNRVVATMGSVSTVRGKEHARASTDGSRNYSKVLTGSEAISPTSSTSKAQKMLESLFQFSKSPEREPSRGPGFDASTFRVAERQQAKGDEYHVCRKTANELWDSSRSCYEEAEAAYSEGKTEYAASLYNQWKIQTKLARAADEKASQEIFKAKNKCIQNVVTFDLRGQHLEQAMKILKLHLMCGTHMASIQTLRVITEFGSNGAGKSELKQSVIELLDKERIEWSGKKRGRLLIKLDGCREFSIVGTESDSECVLLSDQGKRQTKLAWAADEKASQDIFKARNKCIQNLVTFDLHGQHLKQAMKFLKQHILFGTYMASIQRLRVITGYGSNAEGKSVLKQSVIELLDKEGIECSEEVGNPGVLLIKLDGRREFSFAGSE